jgi:hypothetical protein
MIPPGITGLGLRSWESSVRQDWSVLRTRLAATRRPDRWPLSRGQLGSGILSSLRVSVRREANDEPTAGLPATARLRPAAMDDAGDGARSDSALMSYPATGAVRS